MIHLTKALIRRWLDSLLHVDDTPQRTAAAFALGVFFGFSPFLGLHTILGVVFAFLLNLNRVAVLLGIYSNLPWIIAPYYVLATTAGAMSLIGRKNRCTYCRNATRAPSVSVLLMTLPPPYQMISADASAAMASIAG